MYENKTVRRVTTSIIKDGFHLPLENLYDIIVLGIVFHQIIKNIGLQEERKRGSLDLNWHHNLVER